MIEMLAPFSGFLKKPVHSNSFVFMCKAKEIYATFSFSIRTPSRRPRIFSDRLTVRSRPRMLVPPRRKKLSRKEVRISFLFCSWFWTHYRSAQHPKVSFISHQWLSKLPICFWSARFVLGFSVWCFLFLRPSTRTGASPYGHSSAIDFSRGVKEVTNVQLRNYAPSLLESVSMISKSALTYWDPPWDTRFVASFHASRDILYVVDRQRELDRVRMDVRRQLTSQAERKKRRTQNIRDAEEEAARQRAAVKLRGIDSY